MTAPSMWYLPHLTLAYLYAANQSDGVITSIQLEKDELGLKCIREEFIMPYSEGWNHVYSLCIQGYLCFCQVM